MPLINCEIDLRLKWSKKRILEAGTAANAVQDFKTTNAKLHVPVVTLSTDDNVKLLKQLGPAFKITIKWNKYQSKKKTSANQIFRFFNWSKFSWNK